MDAPRYSTVLLADGCETTVCDYDGRRTYEWPEVGNGIDDNARHWRYIAPPPSRFAQAAPTEPISVYTTGYGNRPVSAFFDAVKRVGGYVVDVRHRPYSSWSPDWCLPELEKRFTARRYCHLPALGNQTLGTGRIDIVDVVAGVHQLEEWVLSGRKPLIVLCACGKPDNCHRSKITETLDYYCGIKSAELDWDKERV